MGAVTPIEELRAEAAGCTRCPLYANATTTVFGAGNDGARMVLVGEQPGDQEDRHGAPFVGPAGALLDRALSAAGIDRGQLYVTNAVKHFKWTPRGPRRIHATPTRAEVAACRPWLEAELGAVGPELVVALGATAGKALLGAAFRVTADRGRRLEATVGPWQGAVVATIHPSAVLRVAEPDQREVAFGGLVDDLREAARVMGWPA